MDFKKKTNKTRCRACPASGFCSDVCYNRDVPDANCAHAVKYDKLNKRVASLEGQVETVKFMPLKQRDAELDYDDNVLYGYIGRPDCAKFRDFKAILQDCADNKCDMIWS